MVVDDTVFSLGLEVVVVGWEVEGAAVVKGEVAESVVTVVVIWFHHVLGNIKGVWNQDSLERSGRIASGR